jgi:ribosome maturation factor RimP
MISKKRVLELAGDRMNELNCGLFVVDLSISSTNVIHLELDKLTGNVSINDCMSVSRNIEHNLDRESEDFELHVSSAGLDKPLRVFAQYNKNIGREVNVVTNDSKKHRGLLVSASEKELILEICRNEKIEGKKKKEHIVEQQVIPMNQIKETKIVISFK